MRAADCRLAFREITEGEAEYRYYLSCYRSGNDENRFASAVAVVFATLGLVAVAWLLGGAA